MKKTETHSIQQRTCKTANIYFLTAANHSFCFQDRLVWPPNQTDNSLNLVDKFTKKIQLQNAHYHQKSSEKDLLITAGQELLSTNKVLQLFAFH